MMRGVSGSFAALGLLLATATYAAVPESRVSGTGPQSAGYVPNNYSEDEALPYLQCVPYARQVSGIQIYGDAWTWWDQAEGRYARGNRPRVGAVMSFAPYGKMELGHVAAVSRIIDSRTVLLRHANWSIIGGRRGQVEDNVRAVDVSPDNDWSAVRVWFAPIGNLGTTHWPLNGFIYPEKVKPGAQPAPARLGNARTVIAAAEARPATRPPVKAKASEAPLRPAPQQPVRLASAEPSASSRIGSDFLKGIRPEVPVGKATRQLSAKTAQAPVRTTPRPLAKPAVQTAQQSVKPQGSKVQTVKLVAEPLPRTTRTAQATVDRATDRATPRSLPTPTAVAPVRQPARQSAENVRYVPQRGKAIRGDDPIGRIIASRSR